MKAWSVDRLRVFAAGHRLPLAVTWSVALSRWAGGAPRGCASTRQRPPRSTRTARSMHVQVWTRAATPRRELPSETVTFRDCQPVARAAAPFPAPQPGTGLCSLPVPASTSMSVLFTALPAPRGFSRPSGPASGPSSARLPSGHSSLFTFKFSCLRVCSARACDRGPPLALLRGQVACGNAASVLRPVSGLWNYRLPSGRQSARVVLPEHSEDAGAPLQPRRREGPSRSHPGGHPPPAPGGGRAGLSPTGLRMRRSCGSALTERLGAGLSSGHSGLRVAPWGWPGALGLGRTSDLLC